MVSDWLMAPFILVRERNVMRFRYIFGAGNLEMGARRVNGLVTVVTLALLPILLDAGRSQSGETVAIDRILP
jgi:hypothetical protein